MKDQPASEEKNDDRSDRADVVSDDAAKNLLIDSIARSPLEDRLTPDPIIEQLLGRCTINDRSHANPMSKEEVDKAIANVVDVIAKKGDFGNAFQREDLKSLLESAQRQGTLDEVLQKLNAEIKKSNPDLTISWNTRIEHNSDGSKKTDSTINLINAKTGKPEDQAKVSSKENGPCRIIEPREPDPYPWPRLRDPRRPSIEDLLANPPDGLNKYLKTID